MKSLLRASRFFRPDAGRAALAFLLLVLSTGISLLKPWPLALLVDSVLGGQPWPEGLKFASAWNRTGLLAALGFAVLAVHASHGALAAWANFIAIQVGLRGLARVRAELFHWLQRLSLRFHQGVTQGDLIYRSTWDTYAFQTLFHQGLFTLLQAALSLSLMVVVMWRLNGRLTLVALASVPILVGVMQLFGREMKRRGLIAHAADSSVSAFLGQTIACLPLIQSDTREAREETRFTGRTTEALRKRVAQHGWEVVYWLAVALGLGTGLAVVTWMGAVEVEAGRLTVGQLVVFLAYVTQFHEPLTQLSHLGATVSDATAGAERVFEILDTLDEVRESPDARPVVRAVEPSVHQPDAVPPSSAPLLVRGALTFDQVSFGYNPSRPVLHRVSLDLRPGGSVAIVGPSGAGKTTLLQLLPRFFDPDSGSIRLDGVDLRHLRIKDLREQIAVVFQEPVLFPDTVAANIAFARPDAPRDEIEAAARAAHADEFIQRLPQGYDTPVGEGAARLSAGERQRITLARAFLKNAPILLFDEPTSALDSESEGLVMQGLRQLGRGRTSILVAHRLATIRHVDQIVVLERGVVTASGTPSELLDRSGYYRRIVQELESGR